MPAYRTNFISPHQCRYVQVLYTCTDWRSSAWLYTMLSQTLQWNFAVGRYVDPNTLGPKQNGQQITENIFTFVSCINRVVFTYFIAICTHGAHQNIIILAVNGLVPSRPQATILTNYIIFAWRIYTSPGFNVLTHHDGLDHATAEHSYHIPIFRWQSNRL